MSLNSAHDNVKFASSGGDRSVFVWDVATGATVRRLPGHMGKVNAVEFNDDASVVASGEHLLRILVDILYSFFVKGPSTQPCVCGTSGRTN